MRQLLVQELGEDPSPRLLAETLRRIKIVIIGKAVLSHPTDCSPDLPQVVESVLFGEPRDPKMLFFTESTGFPKYFGTPPSNYKEPSRLVEKNGI